MRRLPLRLAITVLVPLAFFLLADSILLPGADHNALAILRTRGAAPNLSVFALGLAPVVSAYFLVELFAALVPALARSRHGNPAGRARFDRAARALALVIAAMQAWGMAASLQRVSAFDGMFSSGDIGTFSTPLVVVSLVGGVCAMFVAADWISRQGIANGIVLFTVIGAAVESWRLITPRIGEARVLGRLAEKDLAALAIGIVAAALATWVIVRRSDVAEEREASAEQAGVPYRAAHALVTSRPLVPIPASSLAPLPLSIAALSLPGTFIAFAPSLRSTFDKWYALDHWIIALSTVVVTLVLAFLFARLLHRPTEMADLAERLGTKAVDGGEHATAARRALAAAIPATLLFVLAVQVGHRAAMSTPFGGPSIVLVPLLVAMAVDAAAALGNGGFVSVWQERRIAALPAIRAVLVAEGIPSRTRGTAVLSLLQVFGPYAPADILVREEDASRATTVLAHLFLGGPAPDRVPRDTTSSAKEPTAAPRSIRKSVLALCAVAALGAFGLASMKSLPPPSGMPPARLEFVKVDDTIEPFEKIADADVPKGIELRVENAPVGQGRTQRNTYARSALRQGESLDAAAARMSEWLKTIALPDGARFGFEATEEYDPDTGTSNVDGVRTFVLIGDPVITRSDVLEAMAAFSRNGGGEFYVALTFTPEGGERFGDVTREWMHRRFAIVVDDRINSAPVIKSEIRGGRASITMGPGDPEKQRDEATRLAARLMGR